MQMHQVIPGKLNVTGVAALEMAALQALADWDESWSVILGGESGAPRSEFYLSQAETYLKGGFYKDHFSDRAVKASARYTLVLKPRE